VRRPTHRRGAAQIGHQRCEINRGKVSGPTMEAIVPSVEGIPEEPCAGPCFPGFLCRADGHPQGAVSAAALGARATACRACQCRRTPCRAWTAQLVVDVFPWNETPRYLLCDLNRIYGATFQQRVRRRHACGTAIVALQEVCTRARGRTGTTYTANPSSICSSSRRSM
jgi:hypothetical protein